MGVLENQPALWYKHLRFAKPEDHKYLRGHAVVVGGPIGSTGAARMAAYAALRTGAGLATILCDATSLPVYAAAMMAVMTRVVENKKTLQECICSKKVHAVLIGPGAGVNKQTKQCTLAILESGKPCVLDADALTVFAEKPLTLFQAISSNGAEVVLTPHRGEFDRLFSGAPLKSQDDASLACAAAKQSGAVVVLKGSKTTIAAPDGRCVVNEHATPDLATAGAGDVLAGMITSLLAQGLTAFDAATAAVWMHGDAGIRLGAGLIAEDLIGEIPAVLKQLKKYKRV